MVWLGNRLLEVQLNEQEGTICWRWTTDGNYTSRPAYQALFAGSYGMFDSTTIWKGKVEGKHRFFAWLLVQWLTWRIGGMHRPKARRKLKQRLTSLLIYTAWNIWREHNRRIFEGISALPACVVTLIKEEVLLRKSGMWGRGTYYCFLMIALIVFLCGMSVFPIM
ncbi:hypothetical protein HU200_023603 [Digitaria exilis]|uniref:Reverse transcriptase zinc-binding domain-containing protein n=1 Tax=Digitaria exilis TaxID=1010633 RepID=A0A835C4C1_9POAL|nr:hypothetical protein HU200_023603 [Digitaria exilis]